MCRVDAEDLFRQSDEYREALFEFKTNELHYCSSCDEYYDDKADIKGSICNHCNALLIRDNVTNL